VALDRDVRVGIALDEGVGDLVELEAKSTEPERVMTMPRDSCLTAAIFWRSASAWAAFFSAASRAAFSAASWSCVFSRLCFVDESSFCAVRSCSMVRFCAARSAASLSFCAMSARADASASCAFRIAM
jgi:hypothetical protein